MSLSYVYSPQTIQDASINKHIAVVGLRDKGMTVEKTVTLDGKKENLYQIVGEHEKFAVTWGPFTEQKQIQVTLYWTDTAGNGLEPIDSVQEVRRSSLRCSQLMYHFHCLCTYSCPMTRVEQKSPW